MEKDESITIVDQHKLWKERQLMAEVLQHHLQEEAFQNFYGSDTCTEEIKLSINASHSIPQLCLQLNSITLTEVCLPAWNECLYIKATFGDQVEKFPPVRRNADGSYKWDTPTVSLQLEDDRIKWDQICMEIYAQREVSNPIFLGSHYFQLKCLNPTIINQIRILSAPITLSLQGSGFLSLSISLIPNLVATASQSTGATTNEKETHLGGSMALPRDSDAILHEQKKFNDLVSALKGEHIHYIKVLSRNNGAKNPSSTRPRDVCKVSTVS